MRKRAPARTDRPERPDGNTRAKRDTRGGQGARSNANSRRFVELDDDFTVLDDVLSRDDAPDWQEDMARPAVDHRPPFEEGEHERPGRLWRRMGAGVAVLLLLVGVGLGARQWLPLPEPMRDLLGSSSPDSDAPVAPMAQVQPAPTTQAAGPSFAERFRERLTAIEAMLADGQVAEAASAVENLDRAIYGYGAIEFGAIEDRIQAWRDTGTLPAAENPVPDTAEALSDAETDGAGAVSSGEAAGAADAEQERAARERLALAERERVEAAQAAEDARVAEAERAAEAERVAAAERAAEAERVAAAERAAEAERVAAAERAAEAERVAETERAAQAERLAEADRAAQEAERIAEVERAEEAERIAEAQRAAEAARSAEAERVADAERQAASSQAEDDAAALSRQRAIDARAATDRRIAENRAAAQRQALADQAAQDRSAAQERVSRERAAAERAAAARAEAAAEQLARVDLEEPVARPSTIDDADVQTVYRRFSALESAIEAGDINGVTRLTQPSGRRIQQFLQLFENSRSIDARITGIATSRLSGSITGTLRIRSVMRSDGTRIEPGADLASIKLTSRRADADWSKIEW